VEDGVGALAALISLVWEGRARLQVMVGSRGILDEMQRVLDGTRLQHPDGCLADLGPDAITMNDRDFVSSHSDHLPFSRPRAASKGKRVYQGERQRGT
jgi:hypothetical protein